MFTSFIFVLLPALRSQLSIWICWMHEFCGTDLGSEESGSHHGPAACLGEDRRDDRHHPTQPRKDQSGQIRRFAVFDFTFVIFMLLLNRACKVFFHSYRMTYDFAEGP